MRSVREAIRPVPAELRRVLSQAAGDDAAGNGAKSDGRAPGAKPATRGNGRRQVLVVATLRTVSASNAREHWAVRAKRVKSERRAITAALLAGAPLSPMQRANLVDKHPIIRLTSLA